MSLNLPYIWDFSPTSRPLLEECFLAVAVLPPEDGNKWLKRFGLKNLTLGKEIDELVVPEDPLTPFNAGAQEVVVEKRSIAEELVDTMNNPELDIKSKFTVVYEKCMETPNLLTKVAENLPPDILEKLINHIFVVPNENKPFLNNFYEYFIPIYIKKNNSRVCTELLLKINTLHTDCFKILLKVILKDTTLQNSILNDYILMLNGDKQTILLNEISNIDLNEKEFAHNLFNIYTAYKGCNKTENVQKYIFSLLKTHSLYCSDDKNYGKLILAYLQQERDLKTNSNYEEIENLILIHKSGFIRPCLSVLEEIKHSV